MRSLEENTWLAERESRRNLMLQASVSGEGGDGGQELPASPSQKQRPDALVLKRCTFESTIGLVEMGLLSLAPKSSLAFAMGYLPPGRGLFEGYIQLESELSEIPPRQLNARDLPSIFSRAAFLAVVSRVP